jgi:uncharacterized membrane protein HdeD (DUF308 family)
MSFSRTHLERHGLGYDRIRGKWGWFVALGVVLIIVGVLALGDVAAVTLASAIFIGAMLLVGGVVQIVQSFMTKGWASFLLHLLGGALYIIGGLLIMNEPGLGVIWATIFLVAAVIAGGILKIVISLRHRDIPGWRLMLFGGIVSLAVGVLLLFHLEYAYIWLLGTLIAIELIMAGVVWLRFGLDLRRLGHAR